jgi:hypothetical protein
LTYREFPVSLTGFGFAVWSKQRVLFVNVPRMPIVKSLLGRKSKYIFVLISSDKALFKILKKPSIVQKEMISHMKA